MQVRVYLLDRPVNLIDEGVDLAIRILHLPDSTLVAIRSVKSGASWWRRRATSRRTRALSNLRTWPGTRSSP